MSLRAFALLAAGLLVTAAAYLPALDAGFYFDDQANLVDAPGTHWTSLSLDNVRSLVTSVPLPRRVTANLSFALNHLIGGPDPRGYHLVNLVVHLVCGVLLCWVCNLMLRGQAGSSRRAPDVGMAAVIATLLFLAHPLNTQAVTYAVQRMTLLAALFGLASFGCYLRGRSRTGPRGRRRWLLASGALWIAGVGSKENLLVLPLIFLTYEACFHREDWRAALRSFGKGGGGIRATRVVALVVVIGLAVTAFSSLYISPTNFSLTEPFAKRGFSGLERLLTQSRVQWFYLGLLAWPAPSRLNLDHTFAVSRSLVDPPSTLVAVTAWLALACGALALAARRPRYGFPMLAYLELHLVESGPINLELVFEHRMYLPMTMLALLLATALAALPRRWRRIAFGVGLACMAPLAIATHARNTTWSDEVEFHYDCARKSPDKFRPQYNLGTVLGRRGRVAEALPFLERAVRLDPDHSEAHNQLGNALLLLSRPADALAHYRSAVRLKPDNAEAVYNLALLLEQRGEYDEAAGYYRRFVEIAPPYLAGHAHAVRQRLLQPGSEPP